MIEKRRCWLILSVIMLALPFFLLFERKLLAESQENLLFLDQRISADFEPARTFLFWAEAGGGQFYQQPAVSVRTELLDESGTRRVHYLGSRLSVQPGMEKVTYLFAIYGERGEVQWSSPRTSALRELESFERDADQLGRLVELRRRALGELQVQLRLQEESLRRLRQDAEVIGNLGRIVALQERINQLKEEISEREKSIENLSQLVRAAARAPKPQAFARRQADLTQQLRQLTEEAKKAESGEVQRRTSLSMGLQQKLALIEAGRGDSQEELRATLLQLRQQRRDLEERRGEVR